MATLRRIVLGTDSEVLDLGRSSRLFPHHLKEALLTAAMGRCRTPGCDAPLAWLQADHTIPWSRGGPTNTTNGNIRCAACNKAKSNSVADHRLPDDDRLPDGSRETAPDHDDPPDEAGAPSAA